MKSMSANVSMEKEVTVSAINECCELLSAEIESVDIYSFHKMFNKLGSSLIHPKYGKLGKRVAKYIKRHFGIDLSDKLQSAIGKLLSESCGNRSFHVVILPDVSFRPGIFGDDEACFFKNTQHHSSHYRRVLQLMNASAVCVFEHGDPIARAWIIPDRENFVLLNIYTAYGKSLTLDQLAGLLKSMLKKPHSRELHWSNYDLYVNGNKAIVISDNPIEQADELDLEQPACDYDHDECISCRNCGELLLEYYESRCPECNSWVDTPKTQKCASCGDRISDDNCYWYGDDCYCESCFSESFEYCDRCNQAEYRDDMVFVDCEDRFVCQSCADRHYSTCSDCGNLFPENELIRAGDNSVCEDCLDNYSYCEDCEEYHYYDDMIEINPDQFVCQSCAQDYAKCEHCGEMENARDFRFIFKRRGGIQVCDRCYRSLIRSDQIVECKDPGRFRDYFKGHLFMGYTYQYILKQVSIRLNSVPVPVS